MFITGAFEPQNVFLADKEYGLALDALIKACSDVLVLNEDGSRALLGKRKVEPQPDWWLIGGRGRPGDSTTTSAARNVKRELGLDLPPARFAAINSYSMAWHRREQAPPDHGTADIITAHALQLTAEEQGRVRLDATEYSDSRFFPLDEILNDSGAEGVCYHPALKQVVRDLLRNRALEGLFVAVDAERGQPGSLDCEVATAARKLVAAHAASLNAAEPQVQKVFFEGGKYRTEHAE